ncbi:hypothetical protein R3P38DRAFT_2804495 [Favolaschia claudopus]|uniref:F-box domain-containing protein n=1 Tax=Favolaschia claudopus TaxID=2862362 RepID=A0AAV9ZQV4_9AGAR
MALNPTSPLDVQELVDQCIGFVADPDDLIHCALVARSWSNAAQDRLFSTPRGDDEALLELCDTLRCYPYLIRRIRHRLRLTIRDFTFVYSKWDNETASIMKPNEHPSTSLARLDSLTLSPFCNFYFCKPLDFAALYPLDVSHLRHFRISNPESLLWNTVPTSIRILEFRLIGPVCVLPTSFSISDFVQKYIKVDLSRFLDLTTIRIFLLGALIPEICPTLRTISRLPRMQEISLGLSEYMLDILRPINTELDEVLMSLPFSLVVEFILEPDTSDMIEAQQRLRELLPMIFLRNTIGIRYEKRREEKTTDLLGRNGSPESLRDMVNRPKVRRPTVAVATASNGCGQATARLRPGRTGGTAAGAPRNGHGGSHG